MKNTKTMLKTLVLTVALLCTVGALAEDNVYVVTLDQQFGSVNLETGSFHAIGNGTPDGQANLVWGPGQVLYSLSVTGNLVAIDPKTGDSKVIGATGLGFNAFAFAGVRGKLYATDFSGNLYAVDPNSGLATLIGPTGIPADPAIPFTFNPDGTINLCDETLYGLHGRLYATFDSFTLDPNTLTVTPQINAQLYEIDPQTGHTTVVAPTSLNLGATVEDDGRFFAFHLTPIAFGAYGPIVRSQVVRLSLSTGKIRSVVDVDPNASGIVGAAPVRGENEDDDD